MDAKTLLSALVGLTAGAIPSLPGVVSTRRPSDGDSPDIRYGAKDFNALAKAQQRRDRRNAKRKFK